MKLSALVVAFLVAGAASAAGDAERGVRVFSAGVTRQALKREGHQ
jgi:hypothetical protein